MTFFIAIPPIVRSASNPVDFLEDGAVVWMPRWEPGNKLPERERLEVPYGDISYTRLKVSVLPPAIGWRPVSGAPSSGVRNQRAGTILSRENAERFRQKWEAWKAKGGKAPLPSA